MSGQQPVTALASLTGKLAVVGVALLTAVVSAIGVWVNQQINSLSSDVETVDQRAARLDREQDRGQSRDESGRRELRREIERLRNERDALEAQFGVQISDVDQKAEDAQQRAEERPKTEVVVKQVPQKQPPRPTSRPGPQRTEPPQPPPILRIPPLLP